MCIVCVCVYTQMYMLLGSRGLGFPESRVIGSCEFAIWVPETELGSSSKMV